MELIDGKIISAKVREELKNEIDILRSKGKKVPGLVTILVGNNPASEIYVSSKGKACIEIGMLTKAEKLNENISEAELLSIIDSYNHNTDYHGILVQLPLPKHMDEDKVIEAISPKKDVDGFHPVSVGNLVIGKDTFL